MGKKKRRVKNEREDRRKGKFKQNRTGLISEARPREGEENSQRS